MSAEDSKSYGLVDEVVGMRAEVAAEKGSSE